MKSQDKSNKEEMTTITLEIPKDLLYLLKEKAKKLGITYKKLIVKIIHEEVKKISKEIELESDSSN